MEAIKLFVKDYFIFLLLLQMISYLTPKESYKKYMQFFTGALMAIVLLKPLLSWMEGEHALEQYQKLDAVMSQLQEVEYIEEGENMFDIFFLEENME